MAKNVIVSEETVRDLLEAHASLSAWYYELWAALRAANGTARTPDDAARAAFVERLAADFPEIAPIARSIKVPRAYVPAPPPTQGAPSVSIEETPTIVEPAPARVREQADEMPPKPPSVTPPADGPAPPPLVIPGAVKYGE